MQLKSSVSLLALLSLLTLAGCSSGPLLLPVDPDVTPWTPPVDQSAEAAQRGPWDNFMTKDVLNEDYEFRVKPPNPSVLLQWQRFQEDPYSAILHVGAIDYWIVAQLFRSGLLKRNESAQIVAELDRRIAEADNPSDFQPNLIVALVHLGFDEAALAQIAANGDAPWFRDNWDANFYAGTLLFRYRRYAESIKFLERALALHPDAWSRLWLATALHRVPGPEAAERSASLFTFGDHVGGGTAANFPFVDRADSWGLRRWALAGALSFFDMDGDTYLDMVANGVWAHPELYRYSPGKGFTLTDDAALSTVQNTPPGSVVADFNNDGFPDLYSTQAAWFSAGPNRLFKNDGGRRFVDKSATSGDAMLLTQNSCGAAALDFDRDGLVDLAVTGTQGGSIHLLRNRGDFVFEDVSEAAGIPPLQPTTVGLAVGDVNGDGWPDIFVNSFSPPTPSASIGSVGPNRLFINQGDGTFKDEAVSRGVEQGTPMGFASWMFDYDNDGDMDILATTFTEYEGHLIRGFEQKLPHRRTYVGPALYKNDGTGHFQNVTESAGFLPAGYMGAGYLDFDLDGDLDVVLGPGSHPLPYMQPLMFYRNDGGDKFTNITPLDDPDFYGKFHGMAFADVDRDGDPDFYVNNGGVLLSDRFRDLFLENQTKGATWLHLGLTGTESNRSAIGARVEVHVGERKLVQEVAAGQGFSSTNSPYLIFGLGTAPSVDKVQIRWPSGKVQTLPSLTAGQAIIVTEGSKSLRRIY